MCGRPKGFMNAIRLKSPRLRLDSESYRELHRQVLERDGWRCQFCGNMQNLQVHRSTTSNSAASQAAMWNGTEPDHAVR